MRATGILVLIVFAGLLIYAATGLPPYGDPDAPAHRRESAAGTPVAGTYHIQNAYPDAATPNMVTVVLADYRSWDTLGEVVVVFAGGLACYFILRRKGNPS
jgi:multicomponent Na+:H+ antiporter subunit B